MIRPIVGAPISTTSIRDIIPKNMILRIWPNPVSNYINIDAGDLLLTSSPTISIYDNSGKEVMRKSFTEQIDVTPLPDGIYLLILNINGKQAGHNRFIKTR
jgi:hypothetical protein